MEKRKLGASGLSIAPLVLGGNVFGWTVDEAESFRILDAFVDHGLDAIDTADVYSAWVDGNAGGESETIIGRWLAARPGLRERVTLFTKVGSELGEGRKGLSARWIGQAVEDSLARLRTDRIDLYFSHWPDPQTPHEETLRAYQRLMESGKIRAIGASNYDAGLLQDALDTARSEGLPRYSVLQPEYNLYDRDAFEGPLSALCQEQDIGVVTYYSLASGFLSGKYRDASQLEGRARGGSVGKYLNPRGMAILDALDEVAEARAAAPAEIALAWLIHRPGVTAPIASATSVRQVESLARAVSLSLSQDEMDRLTKAGGQART
ncbi:aldo/keto reductase [Aureimonas frigidaquae]|uniref:Aldo/keto reductase n=1 Tax=Aureimonas frigidaquae TaxID=424757 RepID=A0A0P0Z2D0_9HYPH|nr:aldo/keto reductase [Aureimonas frigidaquae]BAT28208.1 aldo/keto reductase [Aureimonas frigidaquae]